jgi:hypothetical protein
MANLTLYYHYPRPVDIKGTPILTTDPTTFVPTDQTTPGVTLAGVDMSVLRDSFGYLTNYPLLMKLFCKDVVTDNTGTFVVSVTGTVVGMSPTNKIVVDRQDMRNFAITWSLGQPALGPSWDTISSSDATVTLTPLAPMTTVSMNCLLGIATDNIDRPEEN